MAGGSGLTIVLGLTTWLCAAAIVAESPIRGHRVRVPAPVQTPHFPTAENCMACHNSLTTGSGEDVSIGSAWRGSIMANSSRDPYWQASVRRETLDHPAHRTAIEDECSTCHMPMARTVARSRGEEGQVFAHLPIGKKSSNENRLAAEGVSCTLCHQISRQGLGTKESFSGGFLVTPATPTGATIFGPFPVDSGRARLMHSATGVTPAEGPHIQESALCATCHTLYTNALGADGRVVGSLPEQVPYLEWQHSAYRTERSCQSCHMPEVIQPTAVASVLGELRPGLSRHTFVGGNAFMLRMLNRYRAELAVDALPGELEANARATLAQLQLHTAAISASAVRGADGVLTIEVSVQNQTGHKFPTGYPSRRSWLHLTVRDDNGRVLFESGAVQPSGAITGNDNDADPSRYEPHHDEIRSTDQVQIYESVMVDHTGQVTTGLLQGVKFIKDNRLLPRGFDKATAAADVAVRGDATTDANFNAARDQVRYRVPLIEPGGPVTIEVALRYQPISFRWARNLSRYDADEPRRFVSYFDAMASESSTVVTRTTVHVR
jgi:hypothetical protein